MTVIDQPLFCSSLLQCFHMGATPPPKTQKCPFPPGISTPNMYVVPWAHLSQHTKQHHDRFTHFCTTDGRMSLYFTGGPALSPPKIASSPRRSAFSPNTWFLGPTQVSTPNGITINSAVFAWLTHVTNTQTD